MIDLIAFFVAIKSNSHEIIEELIATDDYSSSKFNEQSQLGFNRDYSAPAWCARFANPKNENAALVTLEILLNNGFAFNVNSPLIECSSAVVSMYLIDNGALVDQVDPGDALMRTALSSRLSENNYEVAQALLESGANANAKLSKATPILFFSAAAWAKNSLPASDIGKLLDLVSAHSADFDIKDGAGNNIINFFLDPISSIGFKNMQSMISMLDEFLQYDVDVTSKDKNARTPLHQAVGSYDLRKQPFSVISRIFSFGGDLAINDVDLKGQSPLFALMKPASYAGPLTEDDADLIELFIARGADLTTADNNGNTPLHVLCYHACPQKKKPGDIIVGPNLPPSSSSPDRKPYVRILKTLLAAGAPIDHKNGDGKTPKDIAKNADAKYSDFSNIIPNPKAGTSSIETLSIGQDMTKEVYQLFQEANVEYRKLKGSTSESITFRSAWRTVEKQAELHEEFKYYQLFGGPKKNAADLPGDSTHNYGVSLDINIESDPGDIGTALRAAGWSDLYPSEPWHFDAVSAKDFTLAETIRAKLLPTSKDWGETLIAALKAERNVKELNLKLPILKSKLSQMAKKVKETSDDIKAIEKKIVSLDKAVQQGTKKVENQESKVDALKSNWENVQFVCPNGYTLPKCDHTEIINAYYAEKGAKENAWKAGVLKLQELKQQLAKSEVEKNKSTKELKTKQAVLEKVKKAEIAAQKDVDDANGELIADKFLASEARIRISQLLPKIATAVDTGPK